MRISFFAGKHVVDVPDGMTLCGSDGRSYEVVRPRWWRVDRWLAWLFTPSVFRGRVKVCSFDGSVDVRVREVEQ